MYSPPFYRADGKALVWLSDTQLMARDQVVRKIASGVYRLVDNNCLCANAEPQKDVVISEKDRYGFSIDQILCSKCGLIRSGQIFDEESNNAFYQNEYRTLYSGNEKADEKFFYEQYQRGLKFVSQISPYVSVDDRQYVLEIGCGAGGILKAFQENGSEKTIGVDFGENYLTYGRTWGLNLLNGDYQDLIDDESQQLIILSHVMEHFLKPVEEMINITKKIRPNGFFLIEVPGVFWINKIYFNPLLYFQNAHVHNYYYEYLKVFFGKLGLKLIFGNERCTFLLQKPENWAKPNKYQIIYDKSLALYPKKIKRYLGRCYWTNRYYLNPYALVSNGRLTAVKLLDAVGLKNPLKKLFANQSLLPQKQFERKNMGSDNE